MEKMAKRLISRRLLLGAAAGLARAAAAPRKRLVFIAGPKSHPFGQHAHYTGCLFMAERLRRAFPALDAVVVRNGWPADPSVLDGADAIVLFMDCGDGPRPRLVSTPWNGS